MKITILPKTIKSLTFLMFVSLLICNVSYTWAPTDPTLEYQISKVDFKGTAAQVRIDFVVDSLREVTDYLHLLKLEGQWRIVTIIDY